MPHCVRFRTSVAPIFTLLLPTLLIISQIPPGPTRNSKQLDDVRTAPAMATPQCQAVRSKAELLLSDLEGTVAAGERKSIEQSAAKPGPGGSASKALGDQAAAYLLTGNLSAAAWGGLKAAQGQWNGETVTNAGVYLFHLGKKEDALQFLTCAYGSGFRSPYLLEALAILHHANGSTGDARRYINEAAQAEPDDVIIETEASFINTGQPPPARPPARDPDGLDEGLRELEQHAQRALAVIKAQADEIEASIPDSGTREYQRISIDYITKLVDIARDQVRSARAAAPAGRQAMINGALGTFVGAYAQITDDMLSFPDTTELYGSPLLFWADVLGLDSQALHRELQDVEGGKDEASQWSMSTYHGPPLAQPAHVNYFRDKDAGDKDHTDRLRACPAGSDFARSCHVREDGRWCVAWKQLYQRFESESRQRHNAAARGFDRVATRKIIVAENEYLELRDFAVRQLKKMHFLPARATGGYSMEGVTLQGINASIKPVYERHLSSTSDAASGMVPYLRERATWFQDERKSVDETLAQEASEIKYKCEAPLRDLLELLAQEEWEAYLDHLRDRIRWDVQPQTESSFPCEGEIGPLTIEADLNKPGEGKFDLKWKGKSFRAGGAVTVGGGGVTGVGGGVGVRTTSGVTVNATGSSSGGPGFGTSTGYGPFQGKGKVSFTSKVSPWNSQEYLGIKLKGSAGLGLSARRGALGVKCYPSSGSVTIYPRAFYNDAVKYLSTPPTRPAGRTQ